jgi:indole-3-glycerol phosphate synthase
MAAYLDEIVAAHRAEAAVDGRERDLDLDAAVAGAVDGPAPRDFAGALRAGAGAQGIAVIAEIKRRSPSKGDLDPDLDPAAVAADYERGGAACLSVLTDAGFFGGAPDDLRAAHRSCDLPVLRKDFTVRALDVVDARAMGADAVLLIVAALSDVELREFQALARRCGLAALVEVHDEAELALALDAGATLLGVNQRDLRTFEVDRERAVAVGRAIPDGVTKVAESGIRTPEDVARLADAGFHAVLVGETLVRSTDRGAMVSDLLSAVAPAGAGS